VFELVGLRFAQVAQREIQVPFARALDDREAARQQRRHGARVDRATPRAPFLTEGGPKRLSNHHDPARAREPIDQQRPLQIGGIVSQRDPQHAAIDRRVQHLADRGDRREGEIGVLGPDPHRDRRVGPDQ
jgi:hypothetical protein